MTLRALRLKIDELEVRSVAERARTMALADFTLHLVSRIEDLESWGEMVFWFIIFKDLNMLLIVFREVQE